MTPDPDGFAFEADTERLRLDLEEPFGIARGTTERVENVVLALSDGEGHVGRGAALPAARYGETTDTVAAVLPDLLDAVRGLDSPLDLQRAHDAMDRAVRNNRAAKAAVDIALYDLAATRLDVPLYRLLGLDPDRTVTSSYTVGLAPPGEMRRRAEEAVAAGYGVLKVKLGADDDRERVAAVREAAPDARLRVDANEAWTPSDALGACEWLADLDVELLEQPVPAGNLDGLRRVRERAPLPVVADEACATAADVPRLADCADGVNVKVSKCGGVRPALDALRTARAHGLATMCGCMVGTNAAIAAGAHLAPLLDYADLDGSLLLSEDPYEGVPLPGGRVDLAAVERGTGVRRRS